MDFDKLQPKPVVCRQSSITCALACKRCWFYRYRLGIVLRGVKIKEAATLGQIYHRLQLLGPSREGEVLSWVKGQQNALMDKVQRGEDLDGEMGRLATLLTSLYNKALVMTRIFWERFPTPDYLKTIEAETTYRKEYEGLVLEGTIDKIVCSERDNSYWIRDHKSTGRSLDVVFNGLPWSIQARMYRYLVQEKYSVQGFILDGIVRPGIKLCRTDEKNAKEWECPIEDAYLRRVEEWYKMYEVKAELDGKKSAKVIDSKAILFNEPVMPDELKVALSLMGMLSQFPIHPDCFDRDITRTACFAWGQRCVYYTLCSNAFHQWDRLFQTEYKIEDTTSAEDSNEEVEENLD